MLLSGLCLLFYWYIVPWAKNINDDFTTIDIFEEKGIDVPQSNVQYIFSKEYNKIFFKIPSQAASHPFIFHCYPADEKDLITRPEKTVFNNLDFIPTKVPKTIIPKPYFSKSDFIIVQKPLPDYPCSFFNVGQYDPQSGKKTWGIKINNDGLELSQWVVLYTR